MRKNNNYGFWIGYDDGLMKIDSRVNRIDLLANFLIDSSVKANGLRTIQRHRYNYIIIWQDYLKNNFKKEFNIADTIKVIANELVEEDDIYDGINKRLSTRNIKFLKFHIVKILEEVVNFVNKHSYDTKQVG